MVNSSQKLPDAASAVPRIFGFPSSSLEPEEPRGRLALMELRERCLLPMALRVGLSAREFAEPGTM